MLMGFEADHSNLLGSRFTATVRWNGINYGELVGFVLSDEITIHDPLNRRSHHIPMEQYTHFEGNMIEFVEHIIINTYKEEL